MIIIIRKKHVVFVLILAVVLFISISALLIAMKYKKSIETWTTPRGYVTMIIKEETNSSRNIHNLNRRLTQEIKSGALKHM